jgi:hypothetical protein
MIVLELDIAKKFSINHFKDSFETYFKKPTPKASISALLPMPAKIASLI